MESKNKPKIVLFALNSAYIHTNPAVRAICAALGDTYDAKIIEKSLKDPRAKILHELYAENAAVYGFSAYIWNIGELLSYASSLKKLLPDAYIVFGGPEVSYEDEGFFELNPFVDCVIRGEGEGAFGSVCGGVLSGSAPHRAFIDGGHYSGFASSGILYDRFPARSRDIFYYESSRGCPFGCSYCLSSAEKGVRCKNAALVIDELRRFELPEVRGDKPVIIKFIDRTFNFDRERARSIWKALAGGDFTNIYHFEVCAELLEDEDFELLGGVKAGKFLLEIGIQSTCQETLRSINRSTDVKKVLDGIGRLHSAGNLHIHTDLIAGLPYESFERFGKSLDDAYPVCDVLQLGFLKLLKGTRLRRECAEFGYKFMSTPPYEVLSNDFITYDELYRLHEIEAVIEKYSNSGSFAKSASILTEAAGKAGLSPFAVFGRLADFSRGYLPESGDLSQRRSFELFHAFAETVLSSDVLPGFSDALAFDFLISESGRLPEHLKLDEPDLSAYKTGYAETLRRSENPNDVFFPALEAHVFRFDAGFVYLIDRKNHTFEKMPYQG